MVLIPRGLYYALCSIVLKFMASYAVRLYCCKCKKTAKGRRLGDCKWTLTQGVIAFWVGEMRLLRLHPSFELSTQEIAPYVQKRNKKLAPRNSHPRTTRLHSVALWLIYIKDSKRSMMKFKVIQNWLQLLKHMHKRAAFIFLWKCTLQIIIISFKILL